jgi:hypothetical protein
MLLATVFPALAQAAEFKRGRDQVAVPSFRGGARSKQSRLTAGGQPSASHRLPFAMPVGIGSVGWKGDLRSRFLRSLSDCSAFWRHGVG